MKKIAVLIIDDSVYSTDLNLRILKKTGFSVQYQKVENKEEMKKALSDKNWDVILSENNIKGFDAIQALKLRNQIGNRTPFVIVSEDISEKDLIKAMCLGCGAYISKENLKELGQAVKKVLE